MHTVLIDGIEYVPKNMVQSPSEKKILLAMKELVSIHYFDESRKAKALSWNALHTMSPELADLTSDDPSKAWEYINLLLKEIEQDAIKTD